MGKLFSKKRRVVGEDNGEDIANLRSFFFDHVIRSSADDGIAHVPAHCTKSIPIFFTRPARIIVDTGNFAVDRHGHEEDGFHEASISDDNRYAWYNRINEIGGGPEKIFGIF